MPRWPNFGPGNLSDIPHGADLTFRFTPRMTGPMWWINSRSPFRPAADWLTENSPAGPLRVPRDGFYQVNPSVGDALVRTVAAWFAESKGLFRNSPTFTAVWACSVSPAWPQAEPAFPASNPDVRPLSPRK